MTVTYNNKENVLSVGCVARVAAPHLGLSRVRLTVTEPRCCFPGLGRRREVASFRFKEEDWTKVLDGQYQNTAANCPVDLARLQRLQEDLPVKAKWWVGRRKGKTRLDDSLGDVLSLLRSCPRVTLQVVACSEQVSVSWAAQHTEGTLNGPATTSQDNDQDLHVPVTKYSTFVNNTTGRTITLPAHDEAEKTGGYSFPGAWTSQDDLLDEADLKLLRALDGGASSLTDTRNAATEGYCSFINNDTGRIITLPAHEETNDGWTFPGAWTSLDDQLDEQDIQLLHALGGASSLL